MHGAGASGGSLGSARSRHLGAARRRQALCLVEGDDLGRVRPRHQERREVRLDAPLDRWRDLRDEICRDVCENGFDARQNTFVNTYGSQLLDASILMLPAVGFLSPSDPRVLGTITAIEKHMMQGRLRAALPRSARNQR